MSSETRLSKQDADFLAGLANRLDAIEEVEGSDRISLRLLVLREVPPPDSSREIPPSASLSAFDLLSAEGLAWLVETSTERAYAMQDEHPEDSALMAKLSFAVDHLRASAPQVIPTASEPPAHPLLDPIGLTRDMLGQLVREAWVRWATRQPSPKAHWLVPWESLGEVDREADREIGVGVALHTIAHYSASLPDSLSEDTKRLDDAAALAAGFDPAKLDRAEGQAAAGDSVTLSEFASGVRTPSHALIREMGIMVLARELRSALDLIRVGTEAGWDRGDLVLAEEILERFKDAEWVVALREVKSMLERDSETYAAIDRVAAQIKLAQVFGLPTDTTTIEEIAAEEAERGSPLPEDTKRLTDALDVLVNLAHADAMRDGGGPTTQAEYAVQTLVDHFAARSLSPTPDLLSGSPAGSLGDPEETPR